MENKNSSDLYRFRSYALNDDRFLIMSGLQFIQKGRKDEDGTTTTRLNNLEVPLYEIYRYSLSSGTLFGGLGRI